ANELDVPGAELRGLNLKDVTARLDRFRLPGKPFSGFGYRRTYLIAPLPINPQYDRIRLDAGDNLSYHDTRDLVLGQFMRLIQRERVVFLDEQLPSNLDRLGRPESPAARGRESGEPALNRAERFARQVELIGRLVEGVRRDRAENIIIIVPPDGLPQG